MNNAFIDSVERTFQLQRILERLWGLGETGSRGRTGGGARREDLPLGGGFPGRGSQLHSQPPGHTDRSLERERVYPFLGCKFSAFSLFVLSLSLFLSISLSFYLSPYSCLCLGSFDPIEAAIQRGSELFLHLCKATPQNDSIPGLLLYHNELSNSTKQPTTACFKYINNQTKNVAAVTQETHPRNFLFGPARK